MANRRGPGPCVCCVDWLAGEGIEDRPGEGPPDAVVRVADWAGGRERGAGRRAVRGWNQLGKEAERRVRTPDASAAIGPANSSGWATIAVRCLPRRRVTGRHRHRCTGTRSDGAAAGRRRDRPVRPSTILVLFSLSGVQGGPIGTKSIPSLPKTPGSWRWRRREPYGRDLEPYSEPKRGEHVTPASERGDDNVSTRRTNRCKRSLWRRKTIFVRVAAAHLTAQRIMDAGLRLFADRGITGTLIVRIEKSPGWRPAPEASIGTSVEGRVARGRSSRRRGPLRTRSGTRCSGTSRSKTKSGRSRSAVGGI